MDDLPGPGTVRKKRGDKQCAEHPGFVLTYICNDCRQLLCEECEKHVLHLTHDRLKLLELPNTAYNSLSELTCKVKNEYLPNIKERKRDVDELITMNKIHTRKQMEAIEEQKRLINGLADEMIQKCKESEQENERILLKHRGKLQRMQEDFRYRVREADDAYKRRDTVLLCDVLLAKKFYYTDTDIPYYSKVTFKGRRVVDKDFGELSVSRDNGLPSQNRTPCGHGFLPPISSAQRRFDDSRETTFSSMRDTNSRQSRAMVSNVDLSSSSDYVEVTHIADGNRR